MVMKRQKMTLLRCMLAMMMAFLSLWNNLVLYVGSVSADYDEWVETPIVEEILENYEEIIEENVLEEHLDEFFEEDDSESAIEDVLSEETSDNVSDEVFEEEDSESALEDVLSEETSDSVSDEVFEEEDSESALEDVLSEETSDNVSDEVFEEEDVIYAQWWEDFVLLWWSNNPFDRCMTNSWSINIPYEECIWLAYLYTETDGDNWSNNTSWFDNTDITTRQTSQCRYSPNANYYKWSSPSDFCGGSVFPTRNTAVLLTGSDSIKNVYGLSLVSNNLSGSIIDALGYFPELAYFISNYNSQLWSVDFSNNSKVNMVVIMRSENASAVGLDNKQYLEYVDMPGIGGMDSLFLTSPSLYYLNIEYNNLTELDLSALSGIEYINVGYNPDLTILTGVENKTLLRYIEVYNTSIDSIVFQNNQSLQYINIYDTNISSVWWLNSIDLPSLFSLDLRYNQLMGHLELSWFGDLAEIRLSNNMLSWITLSDMDSLNYINVENNQLTSFIANDLNSLSNINIYLQDNLLTQDDIYFTNVSSLHSLRLRDNLFTSFSFSWFSNLNRLDISNNNLSTLSLTNLDNLHYLYLNNNNFSSLSLSELTNLYVLSINNNNLFELSLSDLGNLWHLQLNNNDLSDLSLSGLNDLMYIQLNNNLFTGFTIEWLPKLHQIQLNNNQLESIELVDADDLYFLYINNNNLSHLFVPEDFGRHGDWYLFVDDNQLSSIDIQSSLRSLSATNNNFVDTSSFLINKSNLQYLYLSNNNDLTTASFEEYPDLRYLYLDGLWSLTLLTLLDIPRLNLLYMSDGLSADIIFSGDISTVGFEVSSYVYFNDNNWTSIPSSLWFFSGFLGMYLQNNRLESIDYDFSWLIWELYLNGNCLVDGVDGDLMPDYYDIWNQFSCLIPQWNVSVLIDDFSDGMGPMWSGHPDSFADWFIDDGTARAGVISHNQYSILTLSYDVAQDWFIMFDGKSDSESNYDGLCVFVNSLDNGSTPIIWANKLHNSPFGGTCTGLNGQNQPWGTYYIPVEQWMNTIYFLYRKDGSVNRGEDTVWIDNVYYIYNFTPPSQASGWGGWWAWSLAVDYCPDGDFSGSYYDGECGEKTDLDKTTSDDEVEKEDTEERQTTDTTTSTSEWWQDLCISSPEYKLAYEFAYTYQITTMPTCIDANMDGSLIRSHAAKMMSNYAMNVLDKEPDTEKVCEFDDMWDESNEMKYYAIIACQLWLMWLEADGVTVARSFNPNGVLDKAQFSTVLSRLLYGKVNDWNTECRYCNHVDALFDEWIITVTSDLFDPLRRAFAMIMLMRTKN